MPSKTLSFILAASFSFLGLACDTTEQDLEQELAPAEPTIIDAVELAAQLAEDPSRGIDLDSPILTIRPYDNSEGFRQACGTFPEEQDDLFCEKDQWGWVCCSDHKLALPRSTQPARG